MTRLWIDDERPMPVGYTGDDDWAKTSIEAINILRARTAQGVVYEVISFDHDLGYAMDELPTKIADGYRERGLSDDTTRPVMLWMIENEVWPKRIHVHTANPVGRQWLVGMVRRYAPDGVELSQ